MMVAAAHDTGLGGDAAAGDAAARDDDPEALATLDPEALALLDRLFGADAADEASLASNLHVTGGDLTFGEEEVTEEVVLEGLREELENFRAQEVVASILEQGSELREFARDVEEKLRRVELESIQDYMKESDNLVSLHGQIREADDVLTHMESLLGGFQSDLGAISSEIKSLQEMSTSMGVKLRNRKAAEAKLAHVMDELVVPPQLIASIVDGEVNEGYAQSLQSLDRKLQFALHDPAAQGCAALQDVLPELERLRAKAVAKVREFLLLKVAQLRKPKTNIQILQQSVMLKYKYLPAFLREHGKEVYPELTAAYTDTMNKVLSLHFRTYIQALEKLQLDLVTASDLLGSADTKGSSLFSRGGSARDLKNRSAVFSLGDRASILKDEEQPAIIPHVAQASGSKYPYEVLFRSLHKLLIDTATSEYFFSDAFFCDDAVFNQIFAGPFAVIGEHLQQVLPNCCDAIGLMLMIRSTHQHQLIMTRRRVPCLDAYFDKVNLMLWPRFKMVFDSHLASVKQASARALWEADVHPHYVTRRYAEFAASMLQLNTDHGDGQLDLNLERLRVAVDNLLVELSRLFPKQRQRMIFLINNYDLVLQVFKEAGVSGGKTQQQFEDLLSSFTTVFVEEELREHFRSLIEFVRTRAGTGEEPPSSKGAAAVSPITLQEVEPLLKDFSQRWKGAIELMHKDVITNFSNFVCGMDILRAALTQLLLYYTRLSDCLKRVGGGAALAKDVVSIHSIIYEIRKYSLTF